MNNSKANKRQRIIFAAFALILVATGCVSRRDGVSWADVTLINDDQHILVSYNDSMVIVDPASGKALTLLDGDGEPRVDEEGNHRIWEIVGGEISAKFFASPINIWLDEEENTALVLDYNNRLLAVNFERACFATFAGACVIDEEPPFIELAGRSIADAVIEDNLLFISFSESDVVALDIDAIQITPDCGRYETSNCRPDPVIWTFETDRGLWSAPVIVGDVVYFSCMDHNMYAVDIATGREIWSRDLGSALASAPLYIPGENERFYLGTFGQEVYEISMQGEVLAEYDAKGWIWSTPVIMDDVLYVTDLAGYVYALDTTNGLNELWKTNTESDGIRPSPLITDELVIVASRDGYVHWLTRETGSLRFSKEVGAEILSELILVERSSGALVVVSTVKDDKMLVAFTLDGDESNGWVYAAR